METWKSIQYDTDGDIELWLLISLSETKWSLSAIVPQESTANSNLGCGTIITSGTIAEIRDFWLRYYYYQRYFYLRLESIFLQNQYYLNVKESILFAFLFLVKWNVGVLQWVMKKELLFQVFILILLIILSYWQ